MASCENLVRVLERKYQSQLKKKIKELLPGSIVLKNDPTFLQGVPDLLVLYKDKWCALEVKASSDAPFRPNQSYYISRMNTMSFCLVVNPENEMEVLRDLEIFMKGEASVDL